MFLSQVRGPIIDDSNWRQYAQAVPKDMSKGYESRDWSAHPLGTFCAAFPFPEFPRSEWRDRIEQQVKSRAVPQMHRRGFKSLNQNGTNYCWINAVIQGIHYARVKAGYQHVPLSPASVGAPLKGYRNVGGWGSQGAQYCMEHGVVPQSLWPANAIDRKYDTEASRAERQKYKIAEMYELKPNDIGQLITALLMGFTVAIGLNWWGHEVLAVAPLALGSDSFGSTIDNSWGDWQEDGFGNLNESKSTPDDAVAIRVITGTAQ